MDKKLFKELIQPYLTVDLIVMVIFSVVALKFSTGAGVVCLLATVAVSIYHSIVASKKSTAKLAEIRQGVADENEEITRAFIDSSPLLMCVTDVHGNISWSSVGFREDVTEEENLGDLLSRDDLDQLFADEKSEVLIRIREKYYRITPSSEDDFGHSKRMLFWNDVSDYMELEDDFEGSRPCMAVISVDNYDELLAASAVEEQSTIAAEIDKEIREWAQGLNASISRVRSSNYVMFFASRNYAKLREGKFDILERIHGITNSADFPTTVSIGVGLYQDDFSAMEEYATDAHELALSRGGDQAVVKIASGEIEYYGGATGTYESRSKGRSRIMGHSINQLAAGSDKVIIMGHTRPDMDSLGAAIGMAEYISKINQNVSICINDITDSIDLLYDAAAATGEFRFVSSAEAKAAITPDSLLVVVDTSIPAITEDPELLEKAKKRVIVDHHRRGAAIIENPLLNYTEASASSTSELVAEMMQYQEAEYSRFALEAVLAGITVDTKNYTVNAGSRTFDAAGWLKRMGADGNNVKNFFKMRLDFFQKKVNMIASTQELGNGIAVAYTKDQDPAMQVLVAQAADELLQMRGINTVFVAGSGTEATMVSARSNGAMNVQSFMEQLGGGGHINVAAAQLHCSPEEAIAKVVQLLREEKLI